MEAESLRDRKKAMTRRALVESARTIVDERGLDGTTVEDIAEAAGYTSRTFFNHFSCKEEALVALDPITLAGIVDEVRHRPAGEHPLTVLRAVLIDGADPHERISRWQLRHDLVERYPKLIPQHLAATEEVERALTAALADRLGTDPATDPTVRMLVASVLAVVRAGVSWWAASDRRLSLMDVLNMGFDVTAPIDGPTARA